MNFCMLGSVLMAMTLGAFSQAAERVWTEAGSHKTIKGQIIKSSPESICLKLPNKKEVVHIPLASLSEADKAWVKEFGEKEANRAVIPLEKSTHALNVVYFLGNDRQPVAGYKERLSKLLLYLQQFYGKEMARNGFGNRSFGLTMENPKQVKLIIYKAKGPATDYPYDNGGGFKAAKEVNEFLDATPGLRKSQHTLVIFPTLYNEEYNDKNPGGVPFYGLGRICCALDYKDFDFKHLGQPTPEGRLMTKWYGGLAHELGHGLNMPHNRATRTATKNYGTALMGSGNYTFGSQPTHLTPAHCALLDSCEVFSTDKSKVYYGAHPDVSGLKSSIHFEKGVIKVQGKVEGNVPLKSFVVYVEVPPYGVNRDYEANTFLGTYNPKTKIYSCEIPEDELVEIAGNEFQVRLAFVMDDGQILYKPYNFSREDLKNLEEK